MRRVLSFLFALCFLLPLVPRLTSAKPALENEWALTMPSYMMTGLFNNQIFAENKTNERHDMGELVYGMVALVASDMYKKDTEIEIPKLSRPKTLKTTIIAGEKFTIDDLLRVMLVGSSDEAAFIIASLSDYDVFLKKMNDKSAELGMKDTKFDTVLSIKSIGQYTTVNDMLILYKKLYEIPRVFDMMSEKTFELPETEKAKARRYRTNCYLFDNYLNTAYYTKSVFAGRTGYIGKEVYNIVAYYEVDGVKLILVGLGGKREGNTLSNLKFAKDMGGREFVKDFEAEKIFSENTILAEYKVKNAKGTRSVLMVVKDDIKVLAPKDYLPLEFEKEVIPLKENLKAPIAKGEHLADLRITTDYGEEFAYPLVADSDIKVSYILLVINSLYFQCLCGVLVLWVYWKVCVDIPRKKRRRELELRRLESREWLEKNKHLY